MTDFPTSITDLKRAVNNLKHDLMSDISDVATVIEVASTTGAPATGSFHIDQEVIYYTGLTATTYDPCVRGQDGTAAAPHLKSAGGEVKFGMEAHYINDPANEIEAIETAIGTTAAPKLVKNTGNETIAGVKTFSSSPIVIKVLIGQLTASPIPLYGTIFQ